MNLNVLYHFTLLTFGIILLNACQSTQRIFQDPRDGQKYGYITINDYHWMTENMRYNIEGSKWNPANPDTLFGRLYDGYQAQKNCPEGWYLTTTYNWFALERMILPSNSKDLYKMEKMRGSGVDLFKSKNYWKGTPGTDSLGLNILPAGRYSARTGFATLNIAAFFWTSTLEFDGVAEFRCIQNDSVGIYYSKHIMDRHYYSCRCVRYIPDYEKEQKQKKQKNKPIKNLKEG